jgi:hypothetical protein
LPNLAQLLAQGVLLRRQRHEFFMKELHLLVLWQIRHVVNYGYFLLGDFIHLPHKIDYFPAVAPYLGLMPQARASKMNHAPVLIPLFRTSVKIAVLLQLLVVVIDERPDSRIDRTAPWTRSRSHQWSGQLPVLGNSEIEIGPVDSFMCNSADLSQVSVHSSRSLRAKTEGLPAMPRNNRISLDDSRASEHNGFLDRCRNCRRRFTTPLYISQPLARRRAA